MIFTLQFLKSARFYIIIKIKIRKSRLYDHLSIKVSRSSVYILQHISWSKIASIIHNLGFLWLIKVDWEQNKKCFSIIHLLIIFREFAYTKTAIWKLLHNQTRTENQSDMKQNSHELIYFRETLCSLGGLLPSGQSRRVSLIVNSTQHVDEKPQIKIPLLRAPDRMCQTAPSRRGSGQ